MNGITPDCAPFVFLFLIDDRVTPLEVSRELEQRVVFVGDVLAVDDLLDDFIPPLVIKPGMGHSLLPRRCLQQGVCSTRHVEVDLRRVSDATCHAMDFI